MKEKKLRVLQVHNYYQIPGGEDQVVRNEGNLLKEHGHEVWLYSRRNDDINRMGIIGKLCLPFTACFSLKTYSEVRKIIREKKIDIVHVHNTLPLISPSVFYAAFAMHTPVVMTVHNFRLLCPGGVFYRDGHVCEACVKKGVCHSIRYGCYRNSKLQTMVCAFSIQLHRLLKTYSKLHYICLTDFNKEKLLQFEQIPEGQVYVKPNYMNYSGEVVASNKRDNYVLYAGRLEDSKGIKVLLRAYRELEKENAPRLVICGDGSLRKQCEAYVKKHHLTKVSFAGTMPNDIIKKMMAKAKAIIIPSLLYEGFPMNIAEGYAVRTPVIGSDIGNVGNLIADGVNGWKFKAGDASDLADKIKRCDWQSCSFDVPDDKAWNREGNYQKLMEIYERCISYVRYRKEK